MRFFCLFSAIHNFSWKDCRLGVTPELELQFSQASSLSLEVGADWQYRPKPGNLYMSIPCSLHFLKGGLAQSSSSESPSEQGENYVTFSNRIIQVMSVAAGCKEHPTQSRGQRISPDTVSRNLQWVFFQALQYWYFPTKLLIRHPPGHTQTVTYLHAHTHAHTLHT